MEIILKMTIRYLRNKVHSTVDLKTVVSYEKTINKPQGRHSW